MKRWMSVPMPLLLGSAALTLMALPSATPAQAATPTSCPGPPYFQAVAGNPNEFDSCSTVTTTTSATDTLPNASVTVTRVEGRVISAGTPTVVFDQQLTGATPAQIQGLFAAAGSADVSRAPGATVAAPSLASTTTFTTGPTVVGQTTGPLVSGGLPTFTQNFGPGPVGTGPNGSVPLVLLIGQEDTNTQLNNSQTVTTDEQSTVTSTNTYFVDATITSTTTPPSAPGGTGTGGAANSSPVSSVASSPQLAFTGSNTLALASVGSSLTMLGLALVWVARRRPRRA